MTIGIEAERANTDHPTGVEHYAQQLLLALAAIDHQNKYILYVRTKPREWMTRLPKNFSVKVMPFPLFWTQLRISWEMLFHAPDALFIPASALPLIHPRNSVVTIHDIAWKFFPETFSNGMRWFLTISTWFAVRYAKKVIAVSEQTRTDLLAAYDVDPAKITAVLSGFDAEAEQRGQAGAIATPEESVKISELQDRFVLYLGTLQPRKNVVGLIEAFELLQTEGRTHGASLVIAGGKGWLYDSIIERINENPGIIYFGYVQDRFSLLKRAALLVQPAFYEGFGLQLLDAFWAGIPVASSNVSSLPEVAVDAAEYFDPHDVQSIARAIDTVLGDPVRAEALVAAGSKRLKDFSWKKTATETQAVLDAKPDMRMPTIISTPHRSYREKFFLVVFALVQMFLAVTVATGMIPGGWAWAQIVIAFVGIAAFGEYFGLLSTIIALPFWLALPNPRFDSLSAWRVSAAMVVAVWVFRGLWARPIFSITFWKNAYQQLPKWDTYLLLHAILGAVSILFATFKIVGLKQLLFFISAFSLYFAALCMLRHRQRIREATAAFFAATAAVVTIGYVQLIATFFSNTYRFWQYWATVIARAYYGSALSNSLVYSNSWFSFEPNSAPTLRMFSMLPDSHAFALVALLSSVPAIALLAEAKTKAGKLWLWIYIVLASLSIDLSGTRGAWAGAVVPFVVGIYFAWKWIASRKQVIWSIAPIVFLGLFVVLSPIAQKAIARLDNGYQSSDFLERAETIYNLQESSNAGRLAIWKQTIAYDLHHPVVGTGLGNFVITIAPGNRNYSAIANANDARFNLPARYITAHDLYLDILTQTGLLGFIPFVLYIGSIVFQLWKYAKRSGNQYLIAELIAVIWILAYSVFDGTLENDRVLLFFLFGLAIAANTIRFLKEDSNA
jgi:glycosyltransferase involved in cell wall biosynthesis/O-antigen ligase